MTKAQDSSKSSTIEDVARLAGVSRQTVSRVINRRPNVKGAVRERIEQVIAELGYVPNLSARRMAGARSYLIVAMTDRQHMVDNWAAGRGNAWLDEMLRGGLSACEAAGYHFAFEPVDPDPDRSTFTVAALLSSLRPDGVILAPPHGDNPALVALLRERSVPCARFGEASDGGSIDLPADGERAAAEVANHLVALGHTRIGFVARDDQEATRRLTGLRTAEGVEVSLVRAGRDFDAAVEAVERLLAGDRPTALVAASAELATACLHAAARRELAVPGALSVVSLEDTPETRFSVPPLTAIHHPVAEMIASGCTQLMAIARGEENDTLPPPAFTLVRRASTGPAPG